MAQVALGHAVIDEIVTATNEPLPAILGGAGAYAAIGQALVDPPVCLVSGVGRDFPLAVRADLGRSGVDDAGLVALHAHTPRTTIRYDASGGRVETPAFGLDHFVELDPRVDLVPATYRNAAGVYVFDALTAPLIADLARWRGESGAIHLWELHTGVCAPRHLGEVRERLEDVDLVSLNAAEARDLLGSAEPRAVWDGLGVGAVAAVALRLGSEGALLITEHTIVRATPPPSAVVDPTGAGNAFSGALLAAWTRSAGNPEAALRAAMAAAALTIGQFGPPMLTEEVRDIFAGLEASVSITSLERNTTS